MKRALAIAGGAVVVLLFLWGAMHLFLTQINPAQEAPDRHFGEPCWACHLVNPGAAPIEE